MLGFHLKDINRTTDRQTRPNLLRTCLQLNSLHENSHNYHYFNKIESAQLRLRMSTAGDTQSSYILHTSNVSSYRMRDAPKRVVGVELESIVLFVTRTFQRSTVKTRFLRILYVTDDIDESAEIVSHCIY